MPTPLKVGNVGLLQEQDGSPQWEYGEKITCTRVYYGDYALCLSSVLLKGTIGTGDMEGLVVSKSTCTRKKGLIGQLVVNWEATGDIGQPLPEDEFGVEPFETNPRIETHPAFADLDNVERANARIAALGESEKYRNQAYEWIFANGTGNTEELFNCYNEGVETYYSAGLTYSWTTHYWSLPVLLMGGFIQAPLGPLAGWFDAEISWLRLSDAFSVSNGVYKVTRTWKGAKSGFWRPALYSAT